MRIAYLDCSCGISGDMTLGALLDAGIDAQALHRGIASLGLPGVELRAERVIKGGFRATHVRVLHPEQHAHRHLRDVFAIIDRGALSARQRDLARKIFTAVAEAEARVHGSTVDEVHFHEVGAIDSIVDIVGAAIAFDLLAADVIMASPVPTGRGQVLIDHGLCTVPTPGTAELLKGMPLVDVPVDAELTTPTGAAILKTMVQSFGPLPAMTIQQIGYGAGTKNFPGRANMLRLLVGEERSDAEHDRVVLLETNLDDVPGEVIGYTRQLLFDAGALDVYSTAIQMKKDRPGIILSVLCAPEQADRLEAILFRETGTFGIRRSTCERSKLTRGMHHVETPWGRVQGKLGWRGNEPPLFTPEFEVCAALARSRNLPLREVYRAVEAAFAATPLVKKSITIPVNVAVPCPDNAGMHDHSHDHGPEYDHSHDAHHGLNHLGEHDHDHER